MRNFYTSVILIFCFLISKAQNTQEDSLNKILKLENNNFKRLEILTKLVEVCDIKDNLKYSNEILNEISKFKNSVLDSALSNKLQITKAKAYEYSAIYFKESKFFNKDKVVQLYQNAMEIYQELHLWSEYSRINNGLRYFYVKIGDPYSELQTLKTALDLTTKHNEKIEMAKYIHQLARFYGTINDTTNAIKYANQGIELEKIINDSQRISKGHLLGGEFYNQINQPKKALIHLQIALKRYEVSKDTSKLVDCLLGIAESYRILKNYIDSKKMILNAIDLAKNLKPENNKDLLPKYELIILEIELNHLDDALELMKELMTETKSRNYPGALATGEKVLATIYFKKELYKEAKSHALNALEFMKKFASASQELSLEKICYKCDSALSNYQSAFIHYQNYISLLNKLNTEEINKESIKENLEYKFKQESEKQSVIYESNKKKQQIITISITIGLIIISAFSIFIFYSLRKTKLANKIIAKQKSEVEEAKHFVDEKQKEILESIRYAKRIQNALLPTKQYIKNKLH